MISVQLTSAQTREDVPRSPLGLQVWPVDQGSRQGPVRTRKDVLTSLWDLRMDMWTRGEGSSVRDKQYTF